LRRLRYSERRRLADRGALAALEYEVPRKLRAAVQLHLEQRLASASVDARIAFRASMADLLIRHLATDEWAVIVRDAEIDDWLDFVEILCEVGPMTFVVTDNFYGQHRESVAPSIESALNEMFDRFRFGFSIEGGEVHRLDSPLLAQEVVGPALLAIDRPGWEQVDRTYREAIEHHRASSEIDDALTSAASAVEAALKASGYRGATLGELVKDFRRKPVASGYSPDILKSLSDLLSQLMAWRSHSGNAHGKAPEAEEPPRELATLAIHWAGAFILYLSEAHRSEE
jgi:hypothetical protein